MSNLTYVKPNGEWGIEGVDLSALPPKVYGALCKLKDLEHRETEEAGPLMEQLGTAAYVGHLRDLVQAEQDGRLVVLHAKNGDAIYVKGEDQVVECYIMETYLDDQKGIEYFVSFKCEYLETDNACKGCPFYSWKQDYSGEWSCDGEYGQSCVIAADIGKTVFLTREEAEAALETQKGGESDA